jgi:hypothetical protein
MLSSRGDIAPYCLIPYAFRNMSSCLYVLVGSLLEIAPCRSNEDVGSIIASTFLRLRFLLLVLLFPPWPLYCCGFDLRLGPSWFLGLAWTSATVRASTHATPKPPISLSPPTEPKLFIMLAWFLLKVSFASMGTIATHRSQRILASFLILVCSVLQ